MEKPVEYKWETLERNKDSVFFAIRGDMIRFEVVPEGAHGPEEKQGTQRIEEFIVNPYPWINKYPELHEKTVAKIKQYLSKEAE